MNELTSNNGSTRTASAVLSERVRSLRLPDAAPSSTAAGGWRWLPWVCCAVLSFITAVLALEAFSPIDDEHVKKLAEERGLNLRQDASPGSTAISIPGSSASAGSTNEVVLESKGYIVPISLIQVSPIISATVMKLNVEEGKFVKEGFILAELDTTEFKADRDRAQGTVKSAKARLEELRFYRKDEIQQVKADLDDAIAQRDQSLARFGRVKRLKPSNAVSPDEFESAESGYISNEARVRRLQLAYELMVKGPRDEKIAAATGDLAQAEADLFKAQWKLDKTRVKAPIDGIILSKKTEQGNIVNPSAFSNGLSASLCEMADLREMEVDLSIAERDIAKVFAQQECRIRAEAFSNRIYSGYVSRIMPIADRGKGAVTVRVKIDFDRPAVDPKGKALSLDNQGEYLRPEMGAIVTFLNRKTK